jgi:hypothetical protein
MRIFNIILRYKTILIELILRSRVLISIFILLGVDLSLNLNEEEDIELDSNKIETKNITNTENIPESAPSSSIEIDNISVSTFNNRPSSPGDSHFNLVDTNPLIDKIQSFLNNLDNQSQLILISILIIILCFVYILYIFSFIIAPSIFDVIKDHLPIRVKTFLIKLININRKLSVPFIILSFICLIISLLFAVIFLSIVLISRTN